MMFDISAAQQLGNSAMNYAAKAITMPADQSPLIALEQARQIASEAENAPLVSSAMADELLDLQLAAVVFTVHSAIANYRGRFDPTDLDHLGEQLFEMIQRRGGVRMSLVHAVVVAAQTLGARALDYAREIVASEDAKAPIGSAPVQRAFSDLQIAAVAFVMRLAISEGHEPKRLRRIEKKLVTLFTHQEEL